jgi:hypothetical protein
MTTKSKENNMSNQVEGRDWIGNPDGTLVYWQAEAEYARAKLVRIEKSCDIADAGALVPPGVLSTEVVRAILRGDA